MAKISGYLKDGAGQAVAECAIILTALKTSNQVIEQIESYTTTKDGFYEINALTGQYDVTLTIAGHPPKKVGVITVYNDSPNGTLNDFLANGIDNQAVTPLFLSQLIEERQKAQQAAQAAQKSATQASSTLANVVKKTGDTMNKGLFIKCKDSDCYLSLNNSTNATSYVISPVAGTSKFVHYITGKKGNSSRLAFDTSKDNWNFENSTVTINGADVFKYGDCGVGKSNSAPVLKISALSDFCSLPHCQNFMVMKSASNGALLPKSFLESSATFLMCSIINTRDQENGITIFAREYYSGGKSLEGDTYIGFIPSSNGVSVPKWDKIITSSNISENNLLQKGNYSIGSQNGVRAKALTDDIASQFTGFTFCSPAAVTSSVAKEGKYGFGVITLPYRSTDSGNKYVSRFLITPDKYGANNKKAAGYLQQYSVDGWGDLIELITTANSTIDANGFYKKASPICRLFGDNNTPEVDGFTKSGCGLVNNEACGIEAKRIDVGHYEIHGSLGFAKEGWYITLPEDANGNKKIFAEYTTDENNVITVKTFTRKFDIERCEIVAGEPIDITAERWIDVRLEMPVQEMTESHL